MVPDTSLTPPHVIFRCNLRSLSPSRLSAMVSSSLPSPKLLASFDDNSATDTFCTTLTFCLDTVCPLSSRPARTTPSAPWLSDVLREHRSKLRAAEKSSVEKLCKQTGWTERQIQRWFRRRRNQDRPNLLKKFCEASWRFAFYLLAFIGGLVALIDKPWLYDLEEMWKGFPTLTLLPSQYWYYMLELGFYTSLLFSVASDVKRKDFREQVIHHVATIMLISFSWCVNYIRAGTLIMFMHDSADYLLESAKMFNYARWKNACNYIFILFAAIFIVTRLIIFPFRIMYCTWVYPVTLYPPFFGYYFFNGLLMVLLCLHIFWAALIIRLAFRFLSSNSSVEDERSDREETDESEEEEQMKNGAIKTNGPAQNGHATYNNNHSKKTE
uniref:Ceramide synthase 2b n=1 Tax=Cyprinus carpio carpio TaxID=630221 RepID=A0A9J8AUH0_CYPCA